MKQKIKRCLLAISKTRAEVVLRFLWITAAEMRLLWVNASLYLRGARKPNEMQREQMRQQVTFLFKSFERQRMAKRLYKNIQRYYPGVRVIIVDDSAKPLKLKGPQILQMPFNSGLSAGLNEGLAWVQTPFVVRMDDDERLTLRSDFHKQLDFLLTHKEVDLVGVIPWNLPFKGSRKRNVLEDYKQFDMAPKPLKLPHGTAIDADHTVLGKVPNIFMARAETYRALGYDPKIRMLDHHEFFYRAAGNLVSVLDSSCYVAHIQCPFDRKYHRYRKDVGGDRIYIAKKHSTM